MALPIRNVTRPAQYHIDEHLLLNHLITVNKTALTLRYIQGSNVIFQSMMKYPVELKHFAVYIVTATVPLTMFQQSDEQISSIYPSRVRELITFRFDSIINSQGYLVSSIG